MYKIAIIMLFVFLAGCASEQYNQRVKEIILHETQEGLYEITKDHVRCYICETGKSPAKVSELERFAPGIEYCKPIFKGKEFDSLLPKFTNYKITKNMIKERPGYTIFSFSDNGSKFEQLRNNDKRYWMSIPLSNSELDCTVNELLSDQWNRKNAEHYKYMREGELR
jgi:hypothetical protein